MAERTVRVVLSGDATSLVQAANSARNALNQLGRVDTGAPSAGLRQTSSAAQSAEKDTESLFDKFKSSVAGQVSAGNLISQAVSAAFGSIGGAIGSVLDAGMQYQDTLLNMGAITSTQMQVAGASMADVAVKARALGKDIEIPGASATDAAIAMTELAKGGFSVADSMTAAKGTLQLAAAASIDAGKAAEIQVNAMNAFGLSADQAGHVADVLTNVANQASGDITDFAYGLTAAGATAHSFGISLEDTNTVLGLFANAGIKGEEGGTLMKTMLTRLAAASGPAAGALETLGVTAYDASGNFEGMDKVTQQLALAHQNLTTEAFNSATAIAFGTRGIKGAAILAVQGADGFKKMGDAMLITNSAADIAKAKMSGLSGSFENFMNQVQDLQLTVFATFAPQLTDMVNTFAGAFPALVDAALGAIGYVGTKVWQFLSPIVDGVKALAVQVAPYVMTFATSVKDGITTALDALAPFGDKLAALFDGAKNTGVIDALGLALTGVGAAFSGLMTVIGPIVNLLGGAIGIFTGLPGPIKDIAIALGAAILLKGPLNALFLQAIAGYQRIGLAATASAAEVRTAGGIMSFSLNAAGTAAKGLWAALGGWVGVGITALITGFTLLAGSFGDTGRSADSAKQGVDGMVQALQASNGVMDQSVRAAALQAIQQQQWGKSSSDLTSMTDNLHVSMTQLVDGLSGVAGASEAVEAAYQKQKTALGDVITASTTYDANGMAIVSADGQRAKVSLQILNEQHDAYGQLVTASGGAAAAAVANNAAIAGSADGATGPVTALTQAQQAFIDSSAAGVDPMKAMNDALKEMKQAATDADTAGQFLWATLEQLSGGTITAEQAARLEAAAFRDLGGSARDVADANQKVSDAQAKLDTLSAHLGGTLDGQAVSSSNLAVTQAQVDQASRDLANAQDAASASSDKQFEATVKAAQAGLDAAGAAYAHKAALGDLAGATADASAATQSARDQFVAAETIILGDADAANALADKYHLIPADVVTNLQANGVAAAVAQVTDLNKQLDTANNKTIRYTVIGTQTFQYQTAPGAGSANAAELALPHAAGGWAGAGWVTGAGGPTDDMVAARLSPKEFVVNAAQAQKHAGLLEAINGGLLGFADGGPVPDATAAPVDASASVAVQGAVALPDVAAIQAAWTAISTAVQTAWANIIGPALDALAAATAKTTADWVALQTVTAEPVWTAIGQVVTGTVNAVVLPNYAALDLGTQTVGAEMVNLLNLSVIPVWTQTGAAVANTWAIMIAPTYDQLNLGSGNVGANFQQLAVTTDATWSQIGTRIGDTYNGQIVPAWNGVQSFASAAGGFFTGVQSGVSSATTQITGDIAQITTAIDDFFKMVDGKAPPSSTPPISASLGISGGIPAKADGGILVGSGGPRSDNMLIKASPGEYVVNAASTAKHRETLDAINYGGAFADGGLVGDKISGNIQNAFTAGAEKAITAGVDRVVASMTGGLSTATGFNSSQDPSTFGWVRASNIDSGYSWNGNSVAGGVAKGTEGLWNALLNALVPQIPGGITSQMFGYENRQNVNNPNAASFHSYGLAVDVNAPANPNGAPGYGRSGPGVIPSGPAHAIAAQLGMEWGGDFRGTPDPMHFEIHVPPSGISSAAGGGASASAAPGGSFLSTILDRIKSGPMASAAALAGYSPSGGVAQWHNTVLQALGLTGQPAAYASYVEHQMDTESSGNPRAINNTDMNAQRGDPSRGLMQTIMSTFNAFRLPNLSADIYDPLSNIVASIRYVLARYGSIPAGMRGVAYDNGGPIPPGFTLAYNGTGQTEMGLTNSQWATAGSAINHVTNMAAQSQAPQVINVNYYVDGKQFDGRAEVIVDGKLTQLAQAVTRQSNQVLV